MPRVIKSFITARNPLVITTKSTLILRDIELIEELSKHVEVSVVISVSTLDEKKRELLEPNAAPTVKRLEMLKVFKNIGCKTTVLFMPIIPYISDDDENLDGIFGITKEYCLEPINAWPLHLRGGTKSVFYSFLDTHFPELLPRYKRLYHGGSASNQFKIELHKKIDLLRNKYGLYARYKPTPPKNNDWSQLTLF